MEAQITLKDTNEIVTRIPVEWKKRGGKLDYLSVSKIQSYEQCPACFYHEYLSEETAHVDNANYFTKFGSILHEVAEIMVRTYRDFGLVRDVVQVLNEVWKKYDLTGIEAYEEAKSLITTYFNANPVDERGDTPVLIEKEWRGELGGCTFGLIVDYAGVKKKNPKIGLLRDYKTNRMPFTTADLQSSLQLRIYQIVLRRHLMPEVERWISGYDLFYYGWQQCKEFTEDDLKSAEDYVNNIYNQIINDTVWEEKLNNYCGYRECRHTCQTYQKALRNGEVLNIQYVNNADTDWTAIERERELMTALEKNAKNRKAELDNMMKYHVEECMRKGEKLIIDGQELQLYANSQPIFRYDDVYRVLLTENRLDLLNGFKTIKDHKAFMRLVNAQDMNLKMQLLGCSQNGYSTPYIVKKRS
jgi:RecB family exonuclease